MAMFFFNPRQTLSSDTFEQLGELLRETVLMGSSSSHSNLEIKGSDDDVATVSKEWKQPQRQSKRQPEPGVTILSNLPDSAPFVDTESEQFSDHYPLSTAQDEAVKIASISADESVCVITDTDVAAFFIAAAPVNIRLVQSDSTDTSQSPISGTLRFVLAVTPTFKALLIGQRQSAVGAQAQRLQGKQSLRRRSHNHTAEQLDRSERSGHLGSNLADSNHAELIQCDLVFDPDAIATFLRCLLEHVVPTAPVYSQLNEMLAIAQNQVPNDPNMQSQFTLELMSSLQSTAPSATAPTSQAIAASNSSAQSTPDPAIVEDGLTQRTQILHDAMLAAQAADKAKSEFLAAMSHELRTPLTYILGMSSTLLRWSSSEATGLDNPSIRERQHRYLQNIHHQGEHLLELINDILDLSQLESGKMSLDLHDCSLTLLAQQTLKTYADRAKEKRIRLELDLEVSSELDRFTADPRRLRQVLLNLISNAIKFTPESGKVTLRVAATPVSAIFQIKDTGIGIPEHLKADIFQKFRQLDSSYRRQYEGTGLGLALTKQLVDLHGGRIECESTVNVGTVFTVTLPRTPFVQSRHDESQPAEINTQPLGRIVLIESQDECAHFVSDMLTAAGYQLIWMLEGWTAVNQVEMLQPSIVLIGTCLADIDSCDIIQQLRQNPLTKHLKIMALGSASVPHTTEYFLQAGVDEFLSYPMRPEDLLHAVSLLMATTATARQTS